MSSIIGSNRERKSRIDEGLVERLNKGIVEQNPETNTSNIQSDNSGSHIELLKDMIAVIRPYGRDKFPNSWPTISKDVIQNKDHVLVGTNPYYAIVVDMFLKEKKPGYRLARLIDIQNNLSHVQYYYIDTGLVIRDGDGQNKEQAKKILQQKNNNPPGWLDLRGLEIDDNLNFIRTEESIYYNHSPLNWPTGTRFSKIDDSVGLPIFKDAMSQRKIYTSNSALARGIMNPNGDIQCNMDELFKSGANYTIAIVKVK